MGKMDSCGVSNKNKDIALVVEEAEEGVDSEEGEGGEEEDTKKTVGMGIIKSIN